MKEKIIKTLESELDTAWDDNGHLVYVIYDGDIPDVAENIEQLVNLEVEKRIAERMTSEEEAEEWIQENRWASAKQYVEWLRSRLTNDSQKTEGGGE
jgi:hypothetical protein